MTTSIQAYQPPQTTALSAFSNLQMFETAQRMAKALAESALVPEAYRGNLANCLVALEVAQRCQASPLMVMQNLNIIEGRPAWGSSYIIAAVNSSGRFEPLRFKMVDLGDKEVEADVWEGPKGARQKRTVKIKIHDRSCSAWSVDRSGEVLEGPVVSIETAVKEGWYARNGSKWQTMPDLMLRYRAAAFFGRLYAPEVLMGMRSEDETLDMIDVTPQTSVVDTASVDELNAKIKKQKAAKPKAAPEVSGVAQPQSATAEHVSAEDHF